MQLLTVQIEGTAEAVLRKSNLLVKFDEVHRKNYPLI
jgi:hypothetical protein